MSFFHRARAGSCRPAACRRGRALRDARHRRLHHPEHVSSSPAATWSSPGLRRVRRHRPRRPHGHPLLDRHLHGQVRLSVESWQGMPADTARVACSSQSSCDSVFACRTPELDGMESAGCGAEGVTICFWQISPQTDAHYLALSNAVHRHHYQADHKPETQVWRATGQPSPAHRSSSAVSDVWRAPLRRLQAV